MVHHEDARPIGSDSAHGAEASTDHRWIQAQGPDRQSRVDCAKGKPLARAGRKATGLMQPAGPPTMSLVLRITFATLLAALVIAPSASVAEGGRARAAQQCADADLEASSSNLPRIRAAVVCLHNQIRAQYHQPPLRENKTPAAGRRSATRATW